MLERTIVQNIRKALTARGCWSMKTHGSEVSGGYPDLLVCCSGRLVALEVKRPGEHPTQRQQYELDLIAKAGGVAACVHSVEETLDVLREANL